MRAKIASLPAADWTNGKCAKDSSCFCLSLVDRLAVVRFPLILTGKFLAVTAARKWKDDAGFKGHLNGQSGAECIRGSSEHAVGFDGKRRVEGSWETWDETPYLISKFWRPDHVPLPLGLRCAHSPYSLPDRVLAVIVRSRLCIPIEVHGYRTFAGCMKGLVDRDLPQGPLWPCREVHFCMVRSSHGPTGEVRRRGRAMVQACVRPWLRKHQ